MSILSGTVGNAKNIQSLKNSIFNQRFASSQIFVGPSGIGKKRIAIGLSQLLLCQNRENNQEACGKCGSCQRLSLKQHESVLIIEPENQQIKIERARDIIEFVHLKPLNGISIVIVDGAETMNVQAANSLLKVIEEPGPGICYFFIVKTLSAVLPTIRSRSVIWHFSPLEKNELKNITDHPDWIINASQGSLELASMLSYDSEKNLRLELFGLMSHLQDYDIEKIKEVSRSLLGEKDQVLYLSRLWQQFVRDVVLVKLDQRDRVIHRDQMAVLNSLIHLEFSKLEEIYKLGIHLEESLQRHWDHNLTVDFVMTSAHEITNGRAL
jgi:DNA polymerase-3 subunit delta'